MTTSKSDVISALFDQIDELSEYPLWCWQRLVAGQSDEETIATLNDWRLYAFYNESELLAEFDEGLGDSPTAGYYQLDDNGKIAYIIGKFNVRNIGTDLYDLYAERRNLYERAASNPVAICGSSESIMDFLSNISGVRGPSK